MKLVRNIEGTWVSYGKKLGVGDGVETLFRLPTEVAAEGDAILVLEDWMPVAAGRADLKLTTTDGGAVTREVGESNGYRVVLNDDGKRCVKFDKPPAYGVLLHVCVSGEKGGLFSLKIRPADDSVQRKLEESKPGVMRAKRFRMEDLDRKVSYEFALGAFGLLVEEWENVFDEANEPADIKNPEHRKTLVGVMPNAFLFGLTIINRAESLQRERLAALATDVED